MNTKKWLLRLLLIPYFLWGILLFIAFTLSYFVIIFIISFLFPEKIVANIIHVLLKFWAVVWTYAIGIIPKIYFKNTVITNVKNIYVPNHASYFDSICLYLCIPTYFQTLGKIEISKIFLFGYIYKKVVILVDRNSETQKTKSIFRLKNKMSQMDIAIFPQGTFDSRTYFLEKMYSGAFKIAKELNANLQPILFLDTFNLVTESNPVFFKPGICRIIFLPPINQSLIEKLDAEKLKILYVNYLKWSITYCNNKSIEQLDIEASKWLIKNGTSLNE